MNDDWIAAALGVFVTLVVGGGFLFWFMWHVTFR